MSLDDQILHDSFGGICDSIVGARPTPKAAPNRFSDDDLTFAACVQFAGKWEGAVVVQCGQPVAQLFASKMFMQEPASLAIEQVRDVMQEIANMLAGNIKPLLPNICKLTLPTIVDGRGVTLTIPDTRVINTVGYELDDAPINVTLLEKTPPAV